MLPQYSLLLDGEDYKISTSPHRAYKWATNLSKVLIYYLYIYI